MFFRPAEKNEEKIEITADNRTTILIWLPKKNGQTTTVADVLDTISEARKNNERADVNVGHVALSTPNRYASLWPAESAGGQRFKVVDAAYSTDRDHDVQNEDNAQPDVLVSLFSLDTKAMESAFDDIQDAGEGFALAGDKSITRMKNDRKGNNCNGLVYELLQRGGIDQIEPFAANSEFITYISPDKFETYIKKVKDQEVKIHKDTLNFPKSDEKEYQPRPTFKKDLW